jgi:hypothetical protein
MPSDLSLRVQAQCGDSDVGSPRSLIETISGAAQNDQIFVPQDIVESLSYFMRALVVDGREEKDHLWS